MKILLDTNIWISGLLWGGNPRRVIQLAMSEPINLYSSKALINELQATLAYPKLQRRLKKLEITAEELLVEVAQITQLSQPVAISNISPLRDPKDKIVLETAVSVPVEVIVSGDEDLLVLKKFQTIPILTTNKDVIHLSKSDSRVYLFYRTDGNKRWVCAVTKRLNGSGFLTKQYGRK